MNLLVLTTLYPNPEQPRHGIFIENRLNAMLAADNRVSATVIAPVPWFPLQHPRAGRYSQYARVPASERRGAMQVWHPRYLVIPKIGMWLTPVFLFLSCWLAARRLQRTGERWDLLDAHYFYPDGIAAAILARYLGLPLVISARGSDINLIAQRWLPGKMVRWAAAQAAAVVAVSKALKTAMIKLAIPAESIHVLPNGVNLQLFVPGTDARTPGPYTLLSVGNLVALKGHQLVIEALTHSQDTQLVIIGEGPLRAALADRVKALGLVGRVHFIARLSQPALACQYANADLLVLASSREGMPNVVLEALACGTPVVATAVGGIPEVLTDPQVGRLVERNAQAIAAAIAALRAEPPLRREVRHFAEQFGWASVVSRQLSLYRRLVAAHA